MPTPYQRCFIFLFSALLVACSSLDLPTFDQTSLDNAERLKKSSLMLISKSSGISSGADHQLAINILREQVRRAVEHAGSIEKNDEAMGNWEDLQNEILGPFLDYWEASGNIQPAGRDEFSVQVREAFDALICIEKNKQEPTTCPALSTPDS